MREKRGELRVRQDVPSGNWFVYEGKKAIGGPFVRRQDARAWARALLLERGRGSIVVEAPSGRIQEKLTIRRTRDRREVYAA